jgi:hypothetical protein
MSAGTAQPAPVRGVRSYRAFDPVRNESIGLGPAGWGHGEIVLNRSGSVLFTGSGFDDRERAVPRQCAPR